MQPFNKAIMTDAGSRLFMKAQAGEARIQFTKVAIGDGSYSEDERKISSQQIQTALKSQKNSYPLSKIEVVSDHSVKVTALITNYDPGSEAAIVENGYYINEMGLFAKEYGSEGNETEILYSIAIVQSETGDFMPPYDGNNPAQIIQEYYATVSNSEDVTIEMGKGAVALAEDVEKLTAMDFDDSGEVEGIESFTDFMSSFVKNTSIYQFLANLKAGLKYVLHKDMLVDNCVTDNPDLPLTAKQGKELQDQVTGLYSDITAPGNIQFYFDYQGGKYGYNTNPERGADTFRPFGEIEREKLLLALQNSGLGLTMQSTPEQIYTALANKFPGKVILFNNGTFASGYGIGTAHYAPGSSASNTAFHTRNSKVTVSGGAITTTVSAKGAAGDKNWSASWYLNKMIDLTSYKRLVVVCSAKNGGTSSILKIGKSIPTTGYDPNSIAVAKSVNVPNAGTFEMDLSNIAGSYYIWYTHWSDYGSNEYSASFKEIYLIA